MPPRRRALALLSLACLLTACAGARVDKRTEAFDRTLRSYENALRWGEFETASALLVPREGGTAPAPDADLGDIRVTATSAVDKLLDPEAKEAEVDMVIDFYHEQSGLVRELRDRQQWWFDEEAGRWFLDGSLPDFLGALRERAR